MKKLFYYWAKLAAYLFFCLFHRLSVYGRKNVIPGGGIVAANHTSYYDPPIVGSAAPGEIHFLAKEELFTGKVFGNMIRALNAHPLSGDASDVGIFRKMLSLLAEGKKVILFPEGGRQDEDVFGEVKPGVGMLAMKSQKPIIPTYIGGAHAVWDPSRKLPRLFGKLVCVFGRPIDPKSYAEMPRKEAQVAICKELALSWDALRAWVEGGAKGPIP